MKVTQNSQENIPTNYHANSKHCSCESIRVVHPYTVTTAVVSNEERAKYMIMPQEETIFHRKSQIMTIID